MDAALSIIVGATILGVMLWTVVDGLRERRRMRLRERLIWRTQRATFEASLEDPAFDPARIRSAILAELAALAPRWPRSAAIRDVATEIVEAVNRDGEAEDHVAVDVSLRFRESRGLLARLGWHDVVETSRWTLLRDAGAWIVGDIEPGAADAGGDAVAGPWADVGALRAAAVLELATVDTPVREPLSVDLVSANASPAHTVSDLAMVDGRYADDVLETVVRRLLEAWEHAGRGRPQVLAGLATSAAARRLQHPGRAPGAQLVVRDLSLREVAPVGIGSGTVRVRVLAEGVRYVREPGAVAVLAGSRDARHPIDLVWTLALVPDPDVVWRLEAADDPSRTMYWLPSGSR